MDTMEENISIKRKVHFIFLRRFLWGELRIVRGMFIQNFLFTIYEIDLFSFLPLTLQQFYNEFSPAGGDGRSHSQHFLFSYSLTSPCLVKMLEM